MKWHGVKRGIQNQARAATAAQATQKLRLEYKQVEQQAVQRQSLEQQYATAQASLTEATRARDNLVSVLQALQEPIHGSRLGPMPLRSWHAWVELSTALASLTYDKKAHEAVQYTLSPWLTPRSSSPACNRCKPSSPPLAASARKSCNSSPTWSSNPCRVVNCRRGTAGVTNGHRRPECLEFSPAAHHALRQHIQEQQYVERQYMQLEAARTHLTEELRRLAPA